MKALRQLPLWFLVAMLAGLSGIAAGVALVIHGLHSGPVSVTRAPTEYPPPSFPAPLPPAGPPEPVDTGYIAPTTGGRPRSTPIRPAASHAIVPSPYRTLSPSAAPSMSSSPSPGPSPESPTPCPVPAGAPLCVPSTR